MKAKASDWYKKNWTLDIKNMSWVEKTSNEVDYLTDLCGLRGNERILDLACGYGRHALEFARRGYEVVGVDITKRKYKEPVTKDIYATADDNRCHSKPRCAVVADKGTDKGRKNEHREKPDQPAGIFHYLGHQFYISTKECEYLLMKQCENNPHQQNQKQHQSCGCGK